MRRRSFPLGPFPIAAVLALAIALPSRAAEKPRPAQASQTERIWTNDDMDGLRARGLISLVGPEFPGAAQAAPAPSEAAPYDRTQDPQWYAEQAAELQTELDASQAALQDAQAGLAAAKDRNTQGGIRLDQPNVGITPEAGIAILAARVSEIQGQMNDLSELARINDIPPGVLRG